MIEGEQDYKSNVAYYINSIIWVLLNEYGGLQHLNHWRKLFKTLVVRAIRDNCSTPSNVKEIYMPSDDDLVKQTLFFLQAASPIAFHCMSGQHRLNAIKLLMTGYDIQMSNNVNSSMNLYRKTDKWTKNVYPTQTVDLTEQAADEEFSFGKLRVLLSSFKLDIHFANTDTHCKKAVNLALTESKGIQTTESRQTQNTISDL